MAFDYPDAPHQRRHGPVYGSLQPYRDWLRDDFTFRCVYCLDRERWGRVEGHYDIEHWVAQIHDPDSGLDYDNLFYACHACNLVKGANPVPDPGRYLTSDNVRVDPIDGSIGGLTAEATLIIDVLSDRTQTSTVSYQSELTAADRITRVRADRGLQVLSPHAPRSVRS